jgi:hypothetical protein
VAEPKILPFNVEEEEEQYYPGALPSPNQEDLGAVRDSLFPLAQQGINQTPGFENVRFDGGVSSGGEGGASSAPPPSMNILPYEEDVPEEPQVSGDVDPTWGDYGRMLMSGGASIGGGVGWLMEKLGMDDTGKALQETSNDAVKYWLEGLSPQAKQALQTEFLAEDRGKLWTDAKWNRAKLQTVQSIFGTAAGLGVGSLLTRGLGAVGLTKAATTAAGQTVQVPSKTAGAIGYGAGEASIAAPSAGASTAAQVRDMTHEQLMEQSFEYRALYDLADPNMTEEQKREYAKEFIAEVVAGDAAAKTAFTTFLLSAPAGAYFSKVFGKNKLATGGGFVANRARGAGTEALQEFAQSGSERLSENLAMLQSGGFENTRVFEGVLEEAVGGALSGGIMGAAMPTGSPAPEEVIDTRTGQPTVTKPSGAEDVSATGGVSQAEKEALEGWDETTSETDVNEAGKVVTAPAKEAVPTEPPPQAPQQEQTLPTATAPEPVAPAEDSTTEEAIQQQLRAAAEAEEAAQAEELAQKEDEVVTADDLVEQPVMAEEPVEEPETIESPMISAKDVTKGFADLKKRSKQKGFPGIRKAVQNLGVAVEALFPDAKGTLPSLKGTIGPVRIGKYFEALDEAILIDEKLPNLKGFLAEVVQSPDAASAVQNLNRLTDYVRNSGANVDVPADSTPALAQAAAGISAYDAYEAERLSTKQKYNYKNKKTGKTEKRERISGEKNQIKNRAYAVDNLATSVEALVKEAVEAGVPVPEGVLRLVEDARKMRDRVDTPSVRITKGGAGDVSKSYKVTRNQLTAVGKKLRQAASDIVAGFDARGIDTSEQTEAEAAPKPEPKPRPTEREVQAGELAQEAENQRESDETRAADIAYDQLPKLNPEEELTALEKETTELELAGKLTDKEWKDRQRELRKLKAATEEAASVEAEPEPVTKPTPVTRKTMGKQSKGGMSDVFKTSEEIKTEEGIARDLSSLVNDANKVEELGGNETYEGGKAGYYLAGKITSGGVTKADMKGLSMAQLRSIAKAVGAAPTRSKDATIDRIFKAADAEVTRVEKELAATTEKLDEAGVGVVEVEQTPTEVDPAVQDNLDKLLSLIQQVQVWPADKAAKSKIKLAYHFRTVGDVITRTDLVKPDVVNSLLEIFGASKGKDIVETRGNLMEATAQVVKADRAERKAAAESVEQTTEAAEEAEEIIEVEPQVLARGRASVPITQLLEEFNIEKSDAKLVKGIFAAAKEKGTYAGLYDALMRYRKDRDILNFTAAMSEALGGQPTEQMVGALYRFGEAMAEKAADAISAEQQYEDDRLAEALARGFTSVEEMEEVDEATGWGDSYVPSEFGFDESRLIDRIKKALGIKTKSRLLQERDQKVLAAAHAKLLPMFDGITNVVGQGQEYPPTSMLELIESLKKALPPNHRFQHLLTKLALTGVNADVYIAFNVDEPNHRGSYIRDYRKPNDSYIVLYNNGEADGTIIEAAVHEMIHAVSVFKYYNDAKFRAKIHKVWAKAVREMLSNEVIAGKKFNTAEFDEAVKDGDFAKAMILVEEFLSPEDKKYSPRFYGLKNAFEFMAEGFSNSVFMEQLAKIEFSGAVTGWKVSNLLKEFFTAVKQTLGLSVRNTLLEDVLVLTYENFDTRFTLAEAGRNVMLQRLIAEREKELGETISFTDIGTILESRKVEEKPEVPVGSRNRTLDAARAQKKTIAQAVSDTLRAAKNLGRKGNLAVSGRDAIERENRKLFDKAARAGKIANPLTVYDRAKNLAQTMVRAYEAKAYKLLQDYIKLPVQTRNWAQAIMRDVTLANVDPSQPLNSEANKHLWTKPKKGKPKLRKAVAERAKAARDGWLNFEKQNPEAAKIVKRMAELTREIHNKKVEYALTALGEAFEFSSKDTKALASAKNAKDIDSLIPSNELELLEKQYENANSTDRKELRPKLNQAQARHEAAKSAKTILRESTIDGWYFPLRRYGRYVVSTGPDETGTDRFVAFFESEGEALRFKDKYNAKYAAEDSSKRVSVSVKLDPASTQADARAVMSDLKRRIKDPETKAVLESAISEVLAANASYQSQLKRNNVDGVAAQDMARGFEEYVHVSKYTLGDLRMAHTISNAVTKINEIASRGEFDYGLTTEEQLRAGEVQAEIKKRHKVESGDRKRSKVQKAIGMLGFLNFLGAPSYWVLNSTQTFVVSMPYFAAKYGEVKGTRQLLRAQRMVLAAAAKTMASKDKSYEGFKKQLPPAVRKIVNMMEEDNLVQSTIAHEFGDMLDPQGWKRLRNHTATLPLAKGAELSLAVMERVPEAIEHFNRISTGIAAYNLSNGNRLAMKDAVNETQMNYDTNNRARLLKSLPGVESGDVTKYVTPIMMFKTFGVGMAKLFYGAAFKAAVEKGGRKEGLKLAGYLMATHTLFGGVAGGVMIAPIAVIVAALNAALEPDDKWTLEEAAAEAARELGGDWLAVATERGLPAAILGVDMSRSINLGNLIWMSNDRLDLAEYGDIQQAAFSLFGPVAQYGAGALMEGMRVLNDDPRSGWDDFLRAAVPVKAVRGTLEAIKYSREGITAGTQELQLLDPDEFNSFLQTAFGFQSTQKTMKKSEFYDDKRLEAERLKRRAYLLNWADKSIREKDFDKFESIIEQMQSFNMSVPTMKDRVSQGDIMRLRARRNRAQREYNKKFVYN